MKRVDIFRTYSEAEFVIIATPTNYDPDKNHFNTRTVEAVIANVLAFNTDVTIVIKSTVPVGYTQKVTKCLKQITLSSHLKFYKRMLDVILSNILFKI